MSAVITFPVQVFDNDQLRGGWHDEVKLFDVKESGRMRRALLFYFFRRNTVRGWELLETQHLSYVLYP
jgi:hypothetical protein